jgi:osmotically-inducible protein OsmY
MKRLLVICMAGWLAGCAQPTPPATTPPVSRPPVGTEGARADESISSELRRRLLAEGNELGSVVVNVQAGVVRLSGSVPTVRAAYRAVAAARATAGVVSVENNLLITASSL